MSMKTVIVCKDCHLVCEIEDFELTKKCEHCRERDQFYKERGIEERMDNHASED